jgi:hypothetical protein
MNPLWRKQKRKSLPQDLDEGSNNGGSNIEDSPALPLPASASHGHLRRVVSAATFSAENSQSQTGSPTTPRSFHRRPSRISSFIRTHHSTLEQDSQGIEIPPSLRPGLATNRPLTYNSSAQHTQSDNLAFATPAPETQCTTAHDNLLLGVPTTYSPVAADPFDTWGARAEPSTSVSTPVAPVSRDMAITYALPQPARGFSAPSAPAAPLKQPSTMLNTKSLDTEPEGLDSPSEFALFAAATSSLGFLPSAFDVGSTVENNVAHASVPGRLPPRAAAPRLSITTTFFTPRSRSVPPPSSPSDLQPSGHHRASAQVFPSPSYYAHHSHRSHHAHRLSHQPFSGHHQHRRSQNLQPTSQRAVQALVVSSGDMHLQPHYHHHHHHHHHHPQTYPGATAPTSSTSAAAVNEDVVPPAPKTLDDELLLQDVFIDPDDEELPDYVTSQAQASELQRDKAARRARELEESWQRGRAERARRPWRAWESNGGM